MADNTTKKYASLEILSYFLDKLTEKFSSKVHTHTKSDITDLGDIGFDAIDDGEGNVTLVCSSDINSSEFEVYNNRLSALGEEVATLKAVVNDNDILVADNA